MRTISQPANHCFCGVGYPTERKHEMAMLYDCTVVYHDQNTLKHKDSLSIWYAKVFGGRDKCSYIKVNSKRRILTRTFFMLTFFGRAK